MVATDIWGNMMLNAFIEMQIEIYEGTKEIEKIIISRALL